MHNGKFKNKVVEDISHNRALTILREYKICIKTLPGQIGNLAKIK